LKFCILLLCVVALVVLVGTLQADSAGEHVQPESSRAVVSSELLIGETFPEPISTVFILTGAAAMGLWKLARHFDLV